MIARAIAVYALLTLAACAPKPPADTPLVGPYRLHATDDPAQRAVCIQREGACVQEALPGPGLAAVGFDQRYLVLVQAAADGTEAYYYVARSSDELTAVPASVVHGPLTTDEFAAEQAKLRLPGIAKRF